MPPPPRQPTHSPYSTPTHLFRISCALHFGSASSSRQALLCLLPTNQPAKSFSDVAPTDKWSALGLPACGHYWSMRFSVLLLSFSRHFFILLFFHPIFRSTPLSIVSPMPSIFPPPRPSMPIFTFYFTSRSFIIFLISRGYPFVRDNCRKWGGSGRVDGKRFFVARSNLALRHVRILYSSYLIHLLCSYCN